MIPATLLTSWHVAQLNRIADVLHQIASDMRGVRLREESDERALEKRSQFVVIEGGRTSHD